MSCIQVCNCAVTMSNTGINGCNPLMNVVRKIIFTPKYDSTGALNSINMAATFNAAFFTARVNDIDTTKRWFPLPNLIDVDDKRADPIMQTLSDDRKIFVHDGVRSFAGMIWGQQGNSILAGKIESARCVEMSAYLIDKNGNLLLGSVSDDGTAGYPFEVDSQSIVAQLAYATDKTVVGVKVMFDFDPDQSDSCIRMIKSTELGGANLLNLKGLTNVFIKYGTPTTTGVPITLYLESLNPLNPVLFPGLVTADFISYVTAAASKVRNKTTGADVTVTVTESTVTPGTYTTAWSAQTSGDIIAFKCLKSGADFTNVVSNPVTIP